MVINLTANKIRKNLAIKIRNGRKNMILGGTMMKKTLGPNSVRIINTMAKAVASNTGETSLVRLKFTTINQNLISMEKVVTVNTMTRKISTKNTNVVVTKWTMTLKVS